jgi:hypothetical protein
MVSFGGRQGGQKMTSPGGQARWAKMTSPGGQGGQAGWVRPHLRDANSTDYMASTKQVDKAE